MYIFIAPYERRLGATPYTQYLLIVDNNGELIYYQAAHGGHDFKEWRLNNSVI